MIDLRDAVFSVHNTTLVISKNQNSNLKQNNGNFHLCCQLFFSHSSEHAHHSALLNHRKGTKECNKGWSLHNKKLKTQTEIKFTYTHTIIQKQPKSNFCFFAQTMLIIFLNLWNPIQVVLGQWGMTVWKIRISKYA